MYLFANAVVYTGYSFLCHAGEVGDWENYFDAEMCEEMDNACGDKVKAEGLDFVYKL